jgi:hypothetical protein
MSDIRFTVPVVIHRSYGGFCFTDALINELKTRNWEHLDKMVSTGPDYWFVDSKHEAVIRRDPVLIDVIRKFEFELKELREKGVSWREVAATELTLLNGMVAVEVTVCIDINDHDGKETVEVCGGVW